MKLGLSKYFKQNFQKNSELIGLQVVTLDDQKYFITDFDEFNSETMPKTMFISKKIDSEYGKYKDSDELYVEIGE